jgi:hypothetical protein
VEENLSGASTLVSFGDHEIKNAFQTLPPNNLLVQCISGPKDTGIPVYCTDKLNKKAIH